VNRRRFNLAAAAAVALTLAAPALSRADMLSQEELTTEMVLGDEAAPVTIFAYESLTCPHCAAFHRETLPELKKQYIDSGKVKLVMRDNPLDGLALRAHMLARCAGKDRYFGLVDVLFANQSPIREGEAKPAGYSPQLVWTRPGEELRVLALIGRMTGLDQDDFDACMANQELVKHIVRGIEEGSQSFGVKSTPTFVIDGKKQIVGAQPIEEFDKVLKPLLK